MPDIILFRDCTLLSFYHSLIVVLDRTVLDFFIASPRCRTSNIRVAERCATGTVVPSYDWTRPFHAPQEFSIYGDKDQHLPCASVTLRLEQMPDIILFRDCTLLSIYQSLIVVLDRTVLDFYIASLRCRTSNSRVAERCATGDDCSHLTTEHGHSMSRRGFNPRG